ncbi:MAG: flagellar motor switch protein FliM [Deltaproteobacteria bacterium]|jgi:flagellar motor switch protein FliM|nr:flagellar motor switch protein FliM [Deltaproteobacteria bacterium]MDL1986746.1 flagellar motor switch protein FliM [Deltaproteobacteria bacterium]
MSDQILSQEEIDALLTSVDKGEVDLEVDKKEEAGSYDLTSQSIMLHDQFYALEEVYDKFADLLHNLLSSSLRKSAEVKLVSTEMVKFRKFLEGFSNPTSFNIFNMEPLIGSSLLAIEPELVFFLIDCMFGGNGKPIAQVREFTLIEQRMMRKFAVEVLDSLEKALDVVCSVKISLRKIETKPEFVHMVGPNDLVIAVVFSVKADEFSGDIHLCIPYLMLEPIKDKLSSRYLRDKEIEHVFGAQIQNLLKDTNIAVVAELGRTTYTIRDILNLRAGDIFKLNTGPQDLITIKVEDVPKYQGVPGVVKGNRAVQVTRLFR